MSVKESFSCGFAEFTTLLVATELMVRLELRFLVASGVIKTKFGARK